MDNNSLLERLDIVTTKCKEISERRAQLEGQTTAVLANLKKDFEVSTLEEAEVLLKEMSEELDTKENKLVKGIEEIEDIIENVE